LHLEDPFALAHCHVDSVEPVASLGLSVSSQLSGLKELQGGSSWHSISSQSMLPDIYTQNLFGALATVCSESRKLAMQSCPQELAGPFLA